MNAAASAVKSAHGRHHRHRGGRQREQERQARHHVDTGGHHGRGVDERGHRRRAGHGVGQPHVERQLRALARGADEQEDAAGRGQALVEPERLGEQVGLARRDLAQHREVEAASAVRAVGRVPEQEHAEQEREVTDAVHHERLASGGGVGLVLVPEADQQERAQADALPADEHHRHVGAEHQDEHRAGEQVQVAEVRGVARLVLHVPGRVDVDERRAEGDDQDHHARQRVEAERQVELEIAGLDPGPQVLVELERTLLAALGPHAVGLAQRTDDQVERGEERGRDRGHGDEVHGLARQAFAQHQVEERPCERQERDDPEELDGIHVLGGLVLEDGHAVDVDVTPAAEDRDDDGEADRDFGGGDGHDDHRERVTTQIAVHAREGQDGEVAGVEHQLDAHHDDEHVAAEQHPGGADREQDRGQHQEVGVADLREHVRHVRHLSGLPWLPGPRRRWRRRRP
jgi:hypothetical protein